MLFEILRHTPTWVFVLFFVLLALGYFQARPRTAPRATIAILPAFMLMLSLYGVLSAFGVAVTGLIAWLGGAALAILLGQRFAAPRDASYSAATRTFSVPGSWLPLALMMAIFFTKYGVAVALARNPGLSAVALFIGCVSLVYGFLSGLFFSGVLRMWRMARPGPAQAPAAATEPDRI